MTKSNPTASSPWLFGPGPDLWLGCGGAYAVLFAVLLAAPDALQSAVPLGLLPLLVLVTGVPHYGATLLRVYAQRADRERYHNLAVWASLGLVAWFTLGVYDVTIGSLLVTLYLTWSPWHYTGQNYGLAVMFLRRRGVPLPQRTKQLLYASFLLSYAIAFLGIHAALGAAYSSQNAGASYELLRLGIPYSVVRVALPALGVVWAAVTGVSLLRLASGGHWRMLTPVASLVALQSVWFSVPVLLSATGIFGWPFAGQLETYHLLWLGVAHAVQYLWVTSYYARAAEPDQRGWRHLGRAWLAGCAIWGVPAFLFAPDFLGVRAFDAGLALLVAAAVNLHHFVLDGAIWKLRDGRIARILLRDAVPSAIEPARSRQLPRAIPALVAISGIAYAAATAIGTLEAEFGVRRATDIARLRTAADRLQWIGRDNPGVRYDLGLAALEDGDLETAASEFERSVALSADTLGWTGLGMVAEQEKRWTDALTAYAAALSVNANDLQALQRSASVQERTGNLDAASRSLERALSIDPDNTELRSWLARLRRS